MKLTDKILDILANENRYFSGQELAELMNVSRSAVWKAITQLRSSGFCIDAVTNRGYRLDEDSSPLFAGALKRRLCTNCGVKIYDSVVSTNTAARETAAETNNDMLIIALQQTGGRGRMGRSFYSPEGSGIYMSLLLHPRTFGDGLLYITTAAAVAAARTIEEISGNTAGIKWVNDIYCGGKKVCGILTEASLNLETGIPEYAVLGAGINLYTPSDGFPDDIAGIAGGIFSKKVSSAAVKYDIIAGVVNRFYGYYSKLPEKGFMDEYRRRSVLDGKRIHYTQNGVVLEGVVTGIDENAGLLVTDSSGITHRLSSGEVSIGSAGGML